MANDNIFGELYANTYDEIYGSKDYAEECTILEKIFEQSVPINSILDLGCGTGGHAEEMSRRGYRITGLDQSPQMLDIARAKNLPSCDFQLGDISSFELDIKFDALILMFNVIGYLPHEDRLSALFSTAHRHLRKGGALVFDFWYGPAIRKNPPGNSTKESALDGQPFVRHATGKLDFEFSEVVVDCVLEQGSNLVQESHRVRFFELDELTAVISDAGFTDIHYGQFPEIENAPNADNWSSISWSKAG